MQVQGKLNHISRGHKALASILICVLVGLQLRAIIGPLEDWPFGSCAMFSYYVTPESELYALRTVVELEGPSERTLDALQDIGLPQLLLHRLAFSAHYGSADPYFPQGHFPHDHPNAFRIRMEKYCRSLAAVMQRKSERPKGIRIEIQGRQELPVRLVGRYDVATDLFVLGPVGQNQAD